jgi:anhydro-N-acetylmuramic acid kinase
MTTSGSVPDLRISTEGRRSSGETPCTRHFVGVQLCHDSPRLQGVLVRTWGRGLMSVVDVVASSRCRDGRIRDIVSLAVDAAGTQRSGNRRPALELAELAAEAVAPLIHRLGPDPTSLRAIGLLDFDHWIRDPLGGTSNVACCDTALLAKLTGLTVIDDFPARDLAHGGRGGPCEAVGAWLLLSDRGLIPGRVIRGLVDLDQTLRLFLLPPRQAVQLPSQLLCYQLGPGLSLLDGIVDQMTGGQARFEVKENLAVQARSIPELIRLWQQVCPATPTDWTPEGADAGPLLQVLDEQPGLAARGLPDVLCSAIHWLAQQVATCVQQHLPRSLPVGQVVLGGPANQHPFLLRQIRQQIPQVDVVSMDDLVACSGAWRSTAAAVLAMLHVDQVPGNSPSLTGAQAPRLLGRVTPGSPGNWHRVLSDMASTLPDKMTLRSAI